MSLPPGATLVSGSLPDASQLPPGATLVSGDLPSNAQASPGVLDKANEYAAKALSAAGLPTSISNVPDWFRHLTGTHPDSQPFWAPIREAIKNPTQENIVNAVPFIGPSSVAMSKDVRAGNYGGAAATLAGTVGSVVGPAKAPAIGAGISDAAQASKAPFQNTLAAIKPDLVAHLEKTHSFTGQAAAYLADKMLPDSPEGLAAAQRAVEEGKAKDINDAIVLQDTYNRRIMREKAAVDRATARQQAVAAKQAAQPAAPFPPVLGPDTPTPKQMAASQAYNPEQPVYPGASQPAAEDFYANRGEDIARAMKQQPEAFVPPPKPEFPGASLPSSEDFYSQRGTEINDIRKMQDMEARKRAADTKSAQDAGLKLPSTSGGPKSPNEGRPATWTNDTVRQLAAWGDNDAITQARLRGFGTVPKKYSAVDIAPKSTTLFDAHGNPVPSGGVAPMADALAQKPAENFAYRVRNQGEEGVPIGGSKSNAAHATTTLEDAQRLAPGRGSVEGEPQEIVKYDLSKLKEGKDYERVPREGQPDWIRMLRPLKESEVQPVKSQ